MTPDKLVMESIVETKARTLIDLLDGLRGELHVTLEEGAWAAWLYDVLKSHVEEIVVCNPRRNALLKEGSKGDRVDARKLSELLRVRLLRAVYHGENGLRTLREFSLDILSHRIPWQVTLPESLPPVRRPRSRMLDSEPAGRDFRSEPR